MWLDIGGQAIDIRPRPGQEVGVRRIDWRGVMLYASVSQIIAFNAGDSPTELRFVDAMGHDFRPTLAPGAFLSFSGLPTH